MLSQLHRTLLLLVLVGATATAPAPAAAHTDLLSSSPADGGRVAEPPDQVTLEFLSALVLADDGLVVRGPDGEVLPGRVLASASRTVFTVALEQGAPSGVWTVEYDGVSLDGHPVTGEVVFSVGGGAVAPLSPASDPANFLGGVATVLLAMAVGFVVLLRGLVEPVAGRRRP
ncbi:MAG TPA: copper resistance CopC family protein [Nocardioidaceae bacterium]